MKGLDSFNNLTKHIDQLKSDGFTFVVRYIFLTSGFKEHFTNEEAQALSKAGIRMASVWENGNPTTASYFTVARAKKDAAGMIQEATKLKQPKGTPIYIAVDYDARWADVKDYLATVFDLLKSSDWLPGIYGPGSICMKAIDELGLKYGWLSQSTGFPGYQEYKPKANIVQGKATVWHGIDVDLDECSDFDKAGLWTFETINPPSPIPHKTLKRGDKGDEVKTLQHLLGITEDGDFGPKTEEAVKKYQSNHGLVADGVVGPKTWAKLLGTA